MKRKNETILDHAILKNKPFSPLKSAIETELEDLAQYLDITAPKKANSLRYLNQVIGSALHEDVKTVKNKDVTAYEWSIEGLRHRLSRIKCQLFEMGYEEKTEPHNIVWLVSLAEKELDHVRNLLSKEAETWKN